MSCFKIIFMAFIMSAFSIHASERVAPLTDEDFSFNKNGVNIRIGDELNEKNMNLLGRLKRFSFIEDLPHGDVYYKLYLRSYEGIDVYTSNVFWDKTKRNMNDYIIHKMVAISDEYITPRNIRPGSTLNEVFFSYGSGTKAGNIIDYNKSGRTIRFTIENYKVMGITIIEAYDPDSFLLPVMF